MKNLSHRIPIYLFVGCVFLSACNRSPKADTIIYGGKIYTVNATNDTVESVVIEKGKIIFAGAYKEAEKFKTDFTKLIDIQGNTMIPGLIEGHAHFRGIGLNLLQIDLLKIRNYKELVKEVKKIADTLPYGTWILGRGWHQEKWDTLPSKIIQGFPSHDLLSKEIPNHPVYLSHASGHACLVNEKAMEICGINSLTPSPYGGEIIKDEKGTPTGIFNETAENLITIRIPRPTDEYLEKAFTLASQHCAKNGITSFQDMGTTTYDISAFLDCIEKGELKTRIYAVLSCSDIDTLAVNNFFNDSIGKKIGVANNFLTIRSIKLYADGALGSRGALLLKEYTDKPGEFGKNVTSFVDIEKWASRALQAGFQVCTHCIGDSANREVLNIYEKLFTKYPDKSLDHRWRIEHAQHIDPQDIPRFGALKVIPSMQAIHMASDRPWAIDRLGEERIKAGAYPWKKLYSTGSRIINGTDAPVEPINPIECFYASVTRKTLKRTPENGYEPDQKMTREQALRSYTIDAGYGSFEEKIKGSIEVNKLADFTIFNKDIMTIPEDEILNTQVVMTLVHGKIVFENTPK